MAYGDTEHDAMLKEAWERFCDDLKAASSYIFDDAAPATALDRARGFQFLSQNISLGMDIGLEYADPLYPDFFRMMTPTRKYGGDNPDCLYLRTHIDGSQTYRITGNRGGVHYLVFSAYRPPDATPPGESAEVGRILGKELLTEWDGAFEIVVSPDEHPGNWLRTAPGTSHIIIRQFFGDWAAEAPVNVLIERVGADGPPPPMTPERVAAGLDAGAGWVGDTANYWREWQKRYREQPNAFRASATQGRMGAAPGGVIYHMYWMVQPDEALLIEFTPPSCEYWELELNDYWMVSPDYRYHMAGVNCRQSPTERDGSARVVVSHEDPGVPNWLSTGGHNEGHIGLRWMQCETDEPPFPDTRLVKLADLDGLLPDDALRMDAEGRRAQMEHRRRGIARRFRV